MLNQFSWTDIADITGWSLWLVLGCNTFLLTLICERLWYLWKPLQLRSQWMNKLIRRQLTKKEWDHLFFHEQQRVHIGLPVIRNLIIICPLMGLLGCLLNLIIFLQTEGLMLFRQKTMYNYIIIKLGLPLLIGTGTAIVGLCALLLYVKTIGSVIQHHFYRYK
ncbi:MAG: hypothetical protein OXD32_03655 [Endozoicomonadaceae bacterium]|nr:hypothetical protein [Endozoicomonadaceae bacterium]MCY4330008.1 hypothetical protein [Endozoicomonadaceae bacterium]